MKFATWDKSYLDRRKGLSEKYGPRELWSVIDQWPLYLGMANLSRCLAISDLLRTSLDVPGHVAEFGTWRGSNLMLMAKLLRLYDALGQKQVHGFDSFEGLVEFASEDANARGEKGTYKGSFEELEEVIKLYDMTDDVVIHKGVIEETLPKLLEEKKALHFSFVYCDTDLFASTKTILFNVHPRLMKGGMFVLDEWNYEDFPGESIATSEFLREFSDFYEVNSVPNARHPSLVLRKIRS